MSEQEPKPFLFNGGWSLDAFNTALSLHLKNGNINSIKFLPQKFNLEEFFAFRGLAFKNVRHQKKILSMLIFVEWKISGFNLKCQLMLQFSYLSCNLYLAIDSKTSLPVVKVFLGLEECFYHCSAVRVLHGIPVCQRKPSW